MNQHLRETRRHAELIERRLQDLGHRRSPITAAFELAQGATKQTLVLAKTPLDLLRGGRDVREKMLRNAIDEAMTEGLEIATYDAIESVARGIGDNETAELAAEIRLDEERMLDSLRKEIPALADLLVQEIPSSERLEGEPWAGYDDQTAEEIVKRLDEATPSLVLTVRNYERTNKNRTTVIEATEREGV